MKHWCKISLQYCDDDCSYCVEWLCVCDECHVGGHTDSGGWFGDFSSNPPLVYCEECATMKGLTDG